MRAAVAEAREEFFKLLRSPGIDSKESIPPAYVACTSNRVAVPARRQAGNRFLGSVKALQIRAVLYFYIIVTKVRTLKTNPDFFVLWQCT
jgi:hypothetical protein